MNRTLLVRGDFFDDSSLPSFPSRDAYLLKQVLHHFDETDASVILKNIHSVMDATDVLLVADRMITRGVSTNNSKTHYKKQRSKNIDTEAFNRTD